MSAGRAARLCARYSSLLWTQDPEDRGIEALGKSRMEADPKRWSRFRRECEAAGLKPPAYVKPDKREAWWLSIYGMPEEIHDKLWDVILDKPRIMAEVFAEESSKWAVKKNASIAKLVEEVQHLKDRQRKSVGSPKEEVNIRARAFLKTNPNATARELRDGIGCALGMVSKLPAWKAVHQRRQKERGPTAPHAVALTPKLEKTIGRDDAELERLINDQKQEGMTDGSLLKPSERTKKAKFIPRQKV